MKYSAIVLAGGKGERASLGFNKVFYVMKNGKTVLENACRPFLEDEDCSQVIVVVHPEEVSKIFLQEKMEIAENGKMRMDSVNNGLQKVKEDYVLVHDGARPFLEREALEKLKKAVESTGAAILAHRVKETVKRVKDGKIEETLDRRELCLAETPQGFLTELLKEGFERKREDYEYTDDASIMEAMGKSVYIVENETNNEKLTTAEDFKELV
ncbi:MAG: 2-C-methyl-D-erythritol 4-phosphate cytidylyltransferase [Erysipelotrichaceae bacterium]|nr:2-C-methyl-D-erythritol 4-phosphate cytidylyltransferase [Erysipelotrichaceae bacterium]